MNESQIVSALNEFLALDPVACNELFSTRVPCNKEIEDHEHFVVTRNRSNPPRMGVIGLLNGILTMNGKNKIAMVVSDSGKIERFVIL